MSESANTNVYSYHTYLAPFIWQYGKNKEMKFSEFCEKLEKQKKWERERIEGLKSDIGKTTPDSSSADEQKQKQEEQKKKEEEQNEKIRQTYAAMQYFCPAIRSSIFDTGDAEIVREYSFCQDAIHEKAEYIINKTIKGSLVTYSLDINAIKLKVYNTGIAILILECENRTHRSFACVKNINDYGRRISMPFIPVYDSMDTSICADSIGVNGENINVEVKFKEHISKVYGIDPKTINLNDIGKSVNGKLISDILNLGMNDEIFTTNAPKKAENSIPIKLALDDRMYVMCVVLDNKLSWNYIYSVDGSDKYAFETSKMLSESMYEYVFVDTDGGCSCQDEAMRNELMKSHVYRRWLGYGTIFGASQRSFVALMDESNFSRNVNSVNFLTEYMQIACLSVACYASLDKFEQEIADISILEETQEKYRYALEIRERFLKYRCQLGSNDITFQEQGIETLQMLRDALGIKQEEEEVTKCLDALFSASETRETFNINTFGWLVTGIEIANVFIELFAGWVQIVLRAMLIIVVLIIVYVKFPNEILNFVSHITHIFKKNIR